MTRAVDDLDGDSVLAVAQLVIVSHADGHPCPRCTDDGCDQVPWARDLLDLADTDRRRLDELVASW
ncbi:hypothetical protein [Micromonospora sp. NPDC002575]|uniref:hypothetical protein n=1 Tax=Micromonospora sp. NPDC002575 TaxID=3364222 RepID=UPI0036B613AC